MTKVVFIFELRLRRMTKVVFISELQFRRMTKAVFISELWLRCMTKAGQLISTVRFFRTTDLKLITYYLELIRSSSTGLTK